MLIFRMGEVDLWFWAIAVSMLLVVQPITAKRASERYIQRAALTLAVVAFGLSWTLISTFAGALAMLLSYWHVLSVYRLEKRRHDPDELGRRVRVTTFWLALLLLGTVVLLMTTTEGLGYETAERVLIGVLALSLSVSVLLGCTSAWNFLVRRAHKSPPLSSNAPTVTLAIPARNETHALNDALEQALRSDYPKLEILVLDDCSHDNTSEIIKNFAHKGVRFVQGSEPTRGWLGKNTAYRVLHEEASGELIVFSGVDVHYSPSSISRLVSYMNHSSLDMVSVMPRRRGFDMTGNVLQPLRYISQIALPRPLFGNEPVLSSCWAIRRDSLKKLKGFSKVKGAIIPEQHFANSLAAIHKYNFVLSGTWLNISTRKRFSSQVETATRTLYPMARQELAFVLPALLVAVALFVVPFVVVVLWLLGVHEAAHVARLALACVVVLSTINTALALRVNPKAAPFALVNVPLVVLSHSFMAVWSMLKYEFGEVNWKGRNVCLPVLSAKTPRKQRFSGSR